MSNGSSEDDDSGGEEEDTVQNPFAGGATVANPFQTGKIDAMLEASRQVDEVLERYTTALQVADVVVERNLRALQAFKHIDFSAIDRKLAVAVNPPIFEAVDAANQSALEDMYKVVAAAQQVEEDVADESPELEESEMRMSEGIEDSFYQYIATYVDNVGDTVSSGVRDAARNILNADNISDKQSAFTELFRRADEQMRTTLEWAIWVAIQAVILSWIANLRNDD